MTLNQLFNIPNLKIDNIKHIDGVLYISCSIKGLRGQCPNCLKYSNSVHDIYQRRLSDLPVFTTTTTILLSTRKFKCKNASCKRKVFSEQITDIPRYSRRTLRVSNILNSIAIELTGKLGCILSKELLIDVSCSTLTRICHNSSLPQTKQPKILGIDDWAYRKGVSYGTILIDMETSTPIDILPSRDGDALKQWLKKYPDVEIVTRDRASSYSCAVNKICPNAIQVADRFHLLVNLSDALDKFFKSMGSKINKVIKDKTTDILMGSVTDSESAYIQCLDNKITQVKSDVNENKFDQRIVKFTKVKELQKKKVPIKKIARELGMSRETVRNYFQQDVLTPRNHHKSTNIELFTEHIVSRLSCEGYVVKDIIEEIYNLGYSGGKTQAYSNINIIKEKYKIVTPSFTKLQTTKIPFIKPISSRKLVRYIGRSLKSIEDQDERKYIETLLDNIPILSIVKKLVRIFRTMLKRGKGNIRRWIGFVKKSKSKLTGISSFANGLLSDIEAVENGITTHWSNGAVEGHVNRIKTIKRQMYGRASFDLLRKKIILSQTG